MATSPANSTSDNGVRTPLALAVAIILAGAPVAAAIYARPQPAQPPLLRYTMTLSDGDPVRLARLTGEMVKCQGGLCAKWEANLKHIEWTFDPKIKDLPGPPHSGASDPTQTQSQADQ